MWVTTVRECMKETKTEQEPERIALMGADEHMRMVYHVDDHRPVRLAVLWQAAFHHGLDVEHFRFGLQRPKVKDEVLQSKGIHHIGWRQGNQQRGRGATCRVRGMGCTR